MTLRTVHDRLARHESNVVSLKRVFSPLHTVGTHVVLNPIPLRLRKHDRTRTFLYTNNLFSNSPAFNTYIYKTVRRPYKNTPAQNVSKTNGAINRSRTRSKQARNVGSEYCRRALWDRTNTFSIRTDDAAASISHVYRFDKNVHCVYKPHRDGAPMFA